MKQLTCEMCGSTDLLKQEGVFVCQTCGTKYSVEEAKKMMIEGTVNVSGTVKVDNTDKIKNYLEMAKSAYEAGNKGEAEAYCNRIIEIEPQNYEAWFMKGKAAGWQSTIANVRIEESVQCFSKAVDYAPEDKTDAIKEAAANEISNLSLALISLTCSNFAESPTEGNVESIRTSAINTENYTLQLLVKCGVEPATYKYQAAMKMNEAAVAAYSNCILPEYLEERYPADWRFKNYLEQADFCIDLLQLAIKFADDDYENNVTRYENLIQLNNDALKYGGWTSDYNSDAEWFAKEMRKKGFQCEAVGNYYYTMILNLNDSAKATRRRENDEFRKKIEECKQKAARKKAEEEEKKRAEQQARNDNYWTEHAEEKKNLESELNTLKNEIKQLQEQVAPFDREINELKNKSNSAVPSEKEKDTVLNEISKLRKEQGKLGLFKGKEKKALQAQIDELNSRISALSDSIEKEKKEQQSECNARIKEVEEKARPIKDKITAAQKRINEINTELTKNR